jgi:hypothetical protein
MFPLEGPVTAVLRIFDVVVGVALERSLKDNQMVFLALRKFTKKMATGPSRRVHRFYFELLYWSSLVLLVSLALRSAIGSEVHLKHTYVEAHGPMSLFLKDLVFLVLFGVLLVRAALSESIARFMLWLTMFLVVGIVWSLIDIAFSGGSPFGCRWLGINAVQLVLTVSGWWWLRRKPGRAPHTLALLPLCYAAIFCFDVMQMVEASGPNQTATVWFSGSPPDRTL